MTTERKITIAAVAALVLYVGVDLSFKLKDKLAQARIDGQNQVREQEKKRADDAIAKRDAQWQIDHDNDLKEIAEAKQSKALMAAYATQHSPGSETHPIQVNTGPLETVTLRTGDAVIPFESAPAYFDAFSAGQTCQTDLKKCMGDQVDYKTKYTITQDEFDAEKKVKRRTKWSVLGQAGCSAGGAFLGAYFKGAKGAAIGSGAASTFCGLAF